MKREFTYTITDKEDGISILRFLKNNGYSKNVIKELKKTPEGIHRNGVWTYVNGILHTGDTLHLCLIEDAGSENIVPNAAPLDILYEDDDIFVINKAAGMPTHPSISHYENTLANALAAYNEERNTPMVFRCINRLDMDTSGLTVVAKHMLSSGHLGDDMKARKIHREYLGIAEGLVEDSGTICAPIGRAEGSVIERKVDFANGEHAVTHFKRLKYLPADSPECSGSKNGLSLVSFLLETGRTHQIRVHMKHIGHPLIGDFLYNPANQLMTRQALHAWHLTFSHPINGEKMTFEAPVPDDFILLPD
ncbi:MAG: RluA family pseudouridine synthase [Lachnospiraceae bacterium]|nr:RluA family pseudouridine synthase [Lachnospiraceae bacterium]